MLVGLSTLLQFVDPIAAQLFQTSTPVMIPVADRSYLPLLAQQEDPPKPRDRLIVTHKSPASDLYVRSFGGFATQQGVLGEAAKLQEAVKEDGHDVLTDWFYFASYDPPYRCVSLMPLTPLTAM